MPTKQELLEEKTVKELTQMARDKNLSGYSQLNKDGLIELIKSNYKKAEIKSWPETEEEPEQEEPEEEEPEKETPQEDLIGPETAEIDKSEFKKPEKVETVEVEGDFDQVTRPPQPEKEEDMRKWLFVGVIIAVIVIAVLLWVI